MLSVARAPHKAFERRHVGRETFCEVADLEHPSRPPPLHRYQIRARERVGKRGAVEVTDVRNPEMPPALPECSGGDAGGVGGDDENGAVVGDVVASAPQQSHGVSDVLDDVDKRHDVEPPARELGEWQDAGVDVEPVGAGAGGQRRARFDSDRVEPTGLRGGDEQAARGPDVEQRARRGSLPSHACEQRPLLRAARVGAVFVGRIVQRAVQRVEIRKFARIRESEAAPTLEEAQRGPVAPVPQRRSPDVPAARDFWLNNVE